MSTESLPKNFSNAHEGGPKTFGELLKWRRTRVPGQWRQWTDAAPGPVPPAVVSDGNLRVTFINHSTTLIQVNGINILTDPIYSDRCSPIAWLGPKRVRPPGIRYEDLPPIHLVLLSHNHFDHCDLPTLQRLSKTHSPRYLVGLRNAPLLRNNGIGKRDADIIELDWWQAYRYSDQLTIHGVPAQHWSGRTPFDRGRSLWLGYMLDADTADWQAGKIYFAGDTGDGPHFCDIRNRFGAPRLAILPIGAYLPRWFMAPVHIGPQEALTAHHTLQAKTSVAIHFGTFELADDGETQAPEHLHQLLEEQATPKTNFLVLDFGQGHDVA